MNFFILLASFTIATSAIIQNGDRRNSDSTVLKEGNEIKSGRTILIIVRKILDKLKTSLDISNARRRVNKVIQQKEVYNWKTTSESPPKWSLWSSFRKHTTTHTIPTVEIITIPKIKSHPEWTKWSTKTINKEEKQTKRKKLFKGWKILILPKRPASIAELSHEESEGNNDTTSFEEGAKPQNEVQWKWPSWAKISAIKKMESYLASTEEISYPWQETSKKAWSRTFLDKMNNVDLKESKKKSQWRATENDNEASHSALVTSVENVGTQDPSHPGLRTLASKTPDTSGAYDTSKSSEKPLSEQEEGTTKQKKATRSFSTTKKPFKIKSFIHSLPSYFVTINKPNVTSEEQSKKEGHSFNSWKSLQMLYSTNKHQE